MEEVLFGRETIPMFDERSQMMLELGLNGLIL